jgi:hypothetical protein
MEQKMIGYQCVLRCNSTGDARSKDIGKFLALCGKEFGEVSWEDLNGELLADEQAVELSVAFNLPRDFSKFGLTWTVKSTSEQPPVIVKIAVGGESHVPNFFTVDCSRRDLVAPVDFMRKSVELVRPYEAFISQRDNERWIRQITRERGAGSNDALKALRRIHYLDKSLVARLGGPNNLTNLAEYDSSPFAEGMLLEAKCSETDLNSPSQLNAMEKLGLLQAT